jgi:hypothetical protein
MTNAAALKVVYEKSFCSGTGRNGLRLIRAKFDGALKTDRFDFSLSLSLIIN